MCNHCNENKKVEMDLDKEWMKEIEYLKDVKGFHKIYKKLGTFPRDNLTGQKFGRLTAITAVGRNKSGAVLWLCECECSNKLITLAYSLKKLESKSCGCYNVERAKALGRIDMIGKKFGRLTVLREVEHNGHKLYFECLCDCGNTVIVRGSHLRSGAIQSCKCLNKERIHQASFVNLTGKRFGRLLVTGIAEMPSEENKHKTKYFATCDYGNKVIINGSYLTSKCGTKSCGCLHKEITSKRKLDDLTGKQFGELTVIKRVENTPGGETRYLCRCSCNSLIKVTAPRLKAGQKSCGCIRSKGEYKIAKILQENNISFLKQKEFDDIEGALPKGVFKFDFYIEDRYIVEYDGSQHFIPSNKGWNDLEHFEKTQRRDKCKNDYCKTHGSPII